MIDHLLNTKDVPNYLYDCVIPSLRCMDASVGDIYDILAPRISTEVLTSYKSFFQSKFSETEMDTFRNHPQALVEWVNRNITIDEENNFLRIPISPEGVWRAKVADSFSRDIFFVALARSLNIAADMRKMDGRISYMDPEKDEWGIIDMWKLISINKKKWRHPEAFIVFMRTVRQLLVMIRE